MNEIEKMYKNAGVKKINTHQSEIDNGDPRFTGISHSDSYIKYPLFTAEKQIELIKWLAIHKNNYGLQYFGKRWANCCEFEWESFEECSEDVDFEQSLSGLINIIWKSLTEEERKQIKNILEE